MVAKFVERPLSTPEIRGSNPVIGKIVSTNCTNKNRKDEKEAGMAHLLKMSIRHLILHSHFHFERLSKCKVLQQPSGVMR